MPLRAGQDARIQRCKLVVPVPADAHREARNITSARARTQAQGSAPAPQAAEKTSRNHAFGSFSRWAGQDARIQRCKL